MSEREPDIYFSRDFQVLKSIARWEAAGRENRFLRPETIAEELGRPLDEVMASVGRLYHTGLVDAADATTFGGENYMIRRLTAAGLRESGLWPTARNLADGLRHVLDVEIREAERSDPTRGDKLKIIRDQVADLGTSFLAKFAAELLKGISK